MGVVHCLKSGPKAAFQKSVGRQTYNMSQVRLYCSTCLSIYKVYVLNVVHIAYKAFSLEKFCSQESEKGRWIWRVEWSYLRDIFSPDSRIQFVWGTIVCRRCSGCLKYNMNMAHFQLEGVSRKVCVELDWTLSPWWSQMFCEFSLIPLICLKHRVFL